MLETSLWVLHGLRLSPRLAGALQVLVSPQKTELPDSLRHSGGKDPGDFLCLPQVCLALQVPGQQPVVTDRSEGGQGDFGDPHPGSL